MRSQLLIEIEKYSGTVIFATNLAVNYDGAFKTRMRSILFNKPPKELRRHLWENMLTLPLPLAPDIDFDKLSDVENVVGRDIKNAVVKAAVSTAINSAEALTQSALIDAINEIIVSNKEMDSGGAQKLSETEKREIGAKIRRKLRERARKPKGRV
jgi:AAA+ superfamily predicted ATPase